MRTRGEIIGALDVQSVEPEAFSQEDVAVLQTLADQVAVAISNARLFQRAEESLEAERRAYGEISLQAWRRMVRRRTERGFRCDTEGIVPVGPGLSMTNLQPNVRHEVRSGRVVVEEDGDRPSVSVPIPLRDQVIGALNFRKASEGETWSEEEIVVLQTMAEQLGQALESARLYEDTQRRATQERVIGEVTARMRETMDIETVLRTAVNEMYLALGLEDMVIRLIPGKGPTASETSKEGKLEINS